MIQFDAEVQSTLFGAGVLVLDKNGKAVFTGLDADETRFLVEYEVCADPIDIEEAHRFQDLLAKFHAARQILLHGAEQLVNEQLNRYRYGPLPSE